MPKTYYINGRKIVAEKPLTEDEIDEIAHQNQQPEAEPKGFLSQAWNTISTPPKFVTDTARKVSDWITTPHYSSDQELLNNPYLDPHATTRMMASAQGLDNAQLADQLRQQEAKAAGFTGGAVEGGAGMLSPLNIGLTLAGMGEAAAGRMALSGALSAERAAAAANTARNLGRIRQVTSAPVLAHGLVNLTHGESTPMERLAAVPEIAGGLLGLKMPVGVTPRYSGPLNFTEGDIIPDIPTMRPGLPEPTRGLPEGDFIGGQDINPPTPPPPQPPVGPIARQFPPVLEGEVLPEITDPRITSIKPSYLPPETLPPSGEYGPPSIGYRSPNLPNIPDMGVTPEGVQRLSQQISGGDLDVRAGIEAARAKARAQVDQELAGPQEPQFSMTENGALQTDIDKDAAIDIITNLYEGHIGTVATKELVQNSLDAVRALGNKGLVQVDLNDGANLLTVTDNGPGMTIDQVKTVYTNIGETGKKAGGEDIGGYGVAKAAFQLGGRHFRIETIAKNPKTGRIEKVTFGATPEELRGGLQKPIIEIMPPNTPTGTKVSVTIPESESLGNARSFMENVGKYSGIPGKIQSKYKMYSFSEEPPYTDVPSSMYTSGKELTKISTDIADATLTIPKDAVEGTRSKIDLVIMNKGMYQGTQELSLYSQVPNLPDRIVVDIASKVGARDKRYPFVPSRERLKDSTYYKIREWVNDNLVDPLKSKRHDELDTLYKSLPETQFDTTGTRKFTFYDPKGQITPTEMQEFQQSPELNTISATFSELVDNVIKQMSEFHPHWDETIERIGFMLTEPGYWGVHIPAQGGGKSTIMVNPFNHFVEKGPTADSMQFVPPEQAVVDLVHTIIHEIAHAPAMRGGRLMPHEDAAFEATIGRIYGRMAMQRRYYEDKILGAIYDESTGRYTEGVQRLLHWYKVAVRRTGTTEDLLTGTGLKSANQRPTGPETVSGHHQPHGAGIFEKITKDPVKAEKLREYYNTARGLTAVDLPYLTSAALRQGKFHAFSRPWFEAWVKQAQAFGAESAYKEQQTKIESNPLFAPRWRFVGNRKTYLGSIAEQNGLKLTDINKGLRDREEMIRTELAEQIPYYGRYVRASNRAYTAFLNHIRTSVYEQILTDLGIWDGKKITDPTRAKYWADFVNTTTGIGDLSVKLGPLEANAERYSQLISDAFWSPRLQAANIKMLNPNTYFNEPKETRMAYLKALTRAIGAWMAAATILKLAIPGSKISTDPNSSDFGKVRKGHIRLDPGGGLQQYIVINHRIIPVLINDASLGLIPTKSVRMPGMRPSKTGFPPFDLATGFLSKPGGGITSPISGEFSPYGVGYKPETMGSDITRFIGSKLHPIPRGVVDIASKSQYRPVFVGDKALQMILPMYTSDLADVLREDPSLVPVVLFGSSIGMGTQVFEGGPSKPTITPLFGLDKYDVTLK